jgi:hypothetical protein|tara:strand:- start:2063 stop:2239 length:177 start_codon:yes stop_codon:yes gene_type:complete
MKNEMKDTVEFLGINLGGIGISLTSIDEILRVLVLGATLIYSIQKIIYYYKNRNGNNK